MTTPDEATRTEFNLLDRETIAAVPNLRQEGGPGQPIIDAANLFHRLQEGQKRVLRDLQARSGPDSTGNPTVKYDAGSDATLLLRGEPVESLTARVEEDAYFSLRRQLRAIEAALPEAETQVSITECRVIQEESQKLAPVAQAILQDVVDAAETLLDCLRVEQQFFALCARQGLRNDRRPPAMVLWPQEIGWLNGDVHRPPLAYYIKLRRESAGLDAEDAGKKGR